MAFIPQLDVLDSTGVSLIQRNADGSVPIYSLQLGAGITASWVKNGAQGVLTLTAASLGTFVHLAPIAAPSLPASGWNAYSNSGASNRVEFQNTGAVQVAIDTGKITFGASVSGPVVTQDGLTTAGTAAGQTLTFKAQPGQAQSGGSDNNDGGTLLLAGGDPGTGGGGAVAKQGPLQVQGAGLVEWWGYARATTAPGATVNLGASVAILAGTAWKLRATFTGKIVGPTTTVVYEQECLFLVGNQSGTVKVGQAVGIDSTSLWKTTAPTAPWSAMDGNNVCNVTNVANDGSGHCQVTVDQAVNLRNGATVTVAGVSGATGANVTAIVDSLSGTTFVLRGSTFGGAYTSGGAVTVQACVTVVQPVTTPVQFQAVGLTPATWLAGETVVAGDVRQTGGKVYLYTLGGTVDGAVAPTGTGTGIVDGTAHADYLGAAGSVPSISWTFAEFKQIPL